MHVQIAHFTYVIFCRMASINFKVQMGHFSNGTHQRSNNLCFFPKVE